jgi:hypothetical protein
MKFKALLAAAIMATSSASFASVDDGADQATLTGGELIIAMWDDVAKKSMLFDTGITFKQIIDNKDAVVPTIMNLNAIDSSYKSFFNNDFTNVVWNAYVGSKYSNSGVFDDSKYFGYMFTSKDPAFELANPIGYGEITQRIDGGGERVSRFNENFVSPSDTTDVSVNRAYKANAASDPNYLGDLGTLWGSQMAGTNGQGTTAKSGEYIYVMFNGLLNDETGAPLWDPGVVTSMGRSKFDAETGEFRINTPLPAAAWLLMSGIAGFGAIARRRKQQA